MASPRGGKKIVIVKKKVMGGGGHHGGSWKVAYADFVTAMMAFFMVMWILGMDDKTKKAIEGYFSNPVGYKKGYGAGASPVSTGSAISNVQRQQLKMIVRSSEKRTFEQLKEKILQKLAENDSLKRLNAFVDVQVTNEGLRIELVETGNGDVFFQLGSAQMKPATAVALHIIGGELVQLEHPIVLEGHTDAAQFGHNAAYTNWELSADRANAARRVLQIEGIGTGRLKEVRGYAETMPRVGNDPLAASNRRISILLPFSALASNGEPDIQAAAALRDSVNAAVSHAVSQSAAPKPNP